MTITVYHPGGKVEHPQSLTFDEIQKLVGGYVQMVETIGGQWCCNEDGLSLGLPTNTEVTELVKTKINLPPQGAVGVWVWLTKKDKLR